MWYFEIWSHMQIFPTIGYAQNSQCKAPGLQYEYWVNEVGEGSRERPMKKRWRTSICSRSEGEINDKTNMSSSSSAGPIHDTIWPDPHAKYVYVYYNMCCLWFMSTGALHLRVSMHFRSLIYHVHSQRENTTMRIVCRVGEFWNCNGRGFVNS